MSLALYLTAVDLFSGAGGFSEGLAQAGIKTLLAQELHPQPALTHVFNHPGAIGVVGDIRRLDPQLITDLLMKHHNTKTVDIVVGGPPCQGFSTAGKKNKSDPRNTLFDNYCDIISHLQPKVLVLENVPGFKKMYDGEMYKAAVARLEELGYDLVDKIFNAVDYGVPQRRKRFVMVGIRRDTGLKYAWPDATHTNPEEPLGGLFADLLAPHVSVRDALSDIAFLEPGFEAHRHQAPPQTRFQKDRRVGPYLFNHLATEHRAKAVETFSHIAEGKTIRSVPAAVKSAKVTMARLDRNHISNTVLALPDDLIHYSHHRIPTVREMARLQSFDDDYVFIGKRTSGFVDRKVDVPQYTQVGNAVPPLMAKAIGISIAQMFQVPNCDVRNKEERQIRLKWVHGSSGFSGYTLSRESVNAINLYSITGEKISLPIDERAPSIVEREDLCKWKLVKFPTLLRQWAPGVTERAQELQKQQELNVACDIGGSRTDLVSFQLT